MRKIDLFQRTVSKDPAMQELFNELNDIRGALRAAYSRFDNITSPELVDSCIFELNAIESRYNYLLHAIKLSGGEAVAAGSLSEGTKLWV